MKSAFDYINEMNRLWFQYTPNEWEIKNLGHVSKMIVPMRDKPTSFDGTVPWVRIEDFDGKYISDSKSKQYVSEEFIKSMNLKVFPKGTVMCTCSCTMGATAIVEQPLVSNQTFIGIVPSEKLNSEYLYYLMQASADRLQMFSQGAIQQYLSRHDFEHLKVPLPSIEIQKKIKNFLNKKLESLDKLIHNKNNLLKLLEQQRQSIITEAVTKGLNSNVKMKDSGVEWIGEIPEHWKLTKIKYVAKLLNGDRGENYPSGNDFVEDGVPFITSHNLSNRYVDESNLKFITEKRYSLLRGIKIKKNDIIYCLRGSVGKNSLVTRDGGTVASSLMGIRANTKVNAEFLLYILNSKMEVWNRSMLTTGSVSDNLSAENVGTYLFTFPDLNEQMEIVNYLNSEMLKMEKLLMIIGQQIEKLKEYRQSLIYEAVTGKIDVRDMEID